MVIRVSTFVVCALAVAGTADAADARQRAYERVFGDAVKLDPATVERVKALPPGEMLFLDTDGDGRNDEVWYIDVSPRHQDKSRPLLVRVIDEDGDLDAWHGPDLDSDLYVGDWGADGIVDVVIDYHDQDGDNDVDEMGMYYWSPNDHFLGRDTLRVWWGRDDGDDNLLWFDVNLTYQQRDCQWRTHFAGDETFVAFGLTEDSDHWISIWENPFVFYDQDGDTSSEVVARFSGLADEVEALRYSFDADDDAHGRRVHDYDFSVTAIAHGSRWLRTPATAGSDLVLPEEITAAFNLRGIPTGRWLQREHAQDFARHSPWARAVLTWDEMNANTDGNVARDPNERWEGVIAHPSENFPQIGGPTCGPLNRRNEVSLNPVSPMRLYYDTTDHRLHLEGASEGWIHVDYDLDGQKDAIYTYVDTDSDGIFDRRRIDLDADGQPEFDWPMQPRGHEKVPLEWEALTQVYRPRLEATLADSQVFIDAAKAALDEQDGPDPVETFFLTELESWMPEAGLGARMRETPAGARLYVDLLRDRLLLALKQRFGEHPGWEQIQQTYAAGDYRAAAERLEQVPLPDRSREIDTRAFGSFTARIPLHIDNTGGPQRDDWPMTLAIRELKSVAADFNPDNVAVVAPERWIDWRQVPHQVDRIDPAAGPELSFLIDIRADTSATWYIYYSPEGRSDKAFAMRTDANDEWAPPNIGWESNRSGYRVYWGQFDFFGKKIDKLIYPTIGAENYHQELDWGMDTLLVGTTSGIGGVTLYVEQPPSAAPSRPEVAELQAYPVQNPAGEGDVAFETRILTRGPIRTAVEIVAGNMIPDRPDLKFTMHALSYAERMETEIRVTLSEPDGLLIAPGLMKLVREDTCADTSAGYFGVWGWQTNDIGDIGMGIIAPPAAFHRILETPTEYHALLEPSRTPDTSARAATDHGAVRYWLMGDWRRGRRFPVAPTIDNWNRELAELAQLLLHDIRVSIGQAEVTGTR